MPKELHDVDLRVPRALLRNQSLLSLLHCLHHQPFHRPVSVLRVEPMRRPEAFATRQLGADLEAAVGRREFATGVDATTRIALRAVVSEATAKPQAAVVNQR